MDPLFPSVLGCVCRPHLDVFGDVHLAGPQVTQAGLLDHLTALVGVGHAEGQAAATRPGAGAPGGGLGDAVPLMPAHALCRGRWGGGDRGRAWQCDGLDLCTVWLLWLILYDSK